MIMKLFAGLSGLIAAVLLIALPAMACCGTGQHNSVQITAENTTSSCHDMTAKERYSDDANKQSTHPACDDCPVVAMAASDMAPVIFANMVDIQPFTLGKTQPFSTTAPRYIQTRGPPKNSLLKAQTPITLKQRLMI